MIPSIRIAPAIFVAALLSAACSRPDFSQSDKAAPTSALSVPDVPGWARPLEGRNVATLGAPSGGCTGFVDAVIGRYEGPRRGVELAGWGWDAKAKRPFERVLVVDDGKIVGAGTSHIERPDVTAANPSITAPKTGWSAFVHEPAGNLAAYGVRRSGVCLIARFELKPP